MEVSFVSVCAVGVTAVLIGLCLRRLQKEYALLLSFCAAAVILLWAFAQLAPLIGQMRSFAAQSELPGDAVTALLQCAGIAALSRFVSGLCRDAEEDTLHFAVEFAARCSMLVCCLPMLTELIRFVRQLL